MASDFDPRFDPAFQRGFDGPAPVVERVELPVVERGPTPAGSDASRRDGSAVRVGSETYAAPPTLRGNPFIPALWIVAAIFTLGGAASQYISTFITFSPTASSASVEYVLPAVLTSLSPWLFAAGLAAGIAALVIHALRWRPAD